MKDGRPFTFAGLWEGWKDPECGEWLLQHDDWALFRELHRGNGDVDRYISDLSRPDALTALLNWYRANLAPRMPGHLPTCRRWKLRRSASGPQTITTSTANA